MAKIVQDEWKDCGPFNRSSKRLVILEVFQHVPVIRLHTWGTSLCVTYAPEMRFAGFTQIFGLGLPLEDLLKGPAYGNVYCIRG
jgi:hypothetical protein